MFGLQSSGELTFALCTIRFRPSNRILEFYPVSHTAAESSIVKSLEFYSQLESHKHCITFHEKKTTERFDLITVLTKTISNSVM